MTDRNATLCSDCPPVGYPTDETRCAPCPSRQPTQEAPSSDVTDINALIERIDAGECFNAATASGKARVLLFACQRDIDAQRRVVSKDQALREIKALREALDDAEKVLEGL